MAQQDVTKEAEALLSTYKKENNNTRPCTAPLDRNLVVDLAHRGLKAAIYAAKIPSLGAMGLCPISFFGQPSRVW